MIGKHAKDREVARVAQICNMRHAAYWGRRAPTNHIEKEAARRRGEKDFIPKQNGIRIDLILAARRHEAKKKSTQKK